MPPIRTRLIRYYEETIPAGGGHRQEKTTIFGWCAMFLVMALGFSGWVNDTIAARNPIWADLPKVWNGWELQAPDFVKPRQFGAGATEDKPSQPIASAPKTKDKSAKLETAPTFSGDTFANSGKLSIRQPDVQLAASRADRSATLLRSAKPLLAGLTRASCAIPSDPCCDIAGRGINEFSQSGRNCRHWQTTRFV